uniref:Uncharacterized protein n=1 Tax=Oryzias melastigma TaxID=30732 RepID=A0A3B3C2F4_ORYME
MNSKFIVCAPSAVLLTTPSKDRASQSLHTLHENGEKLFCSSCHFVIEHKRKSSIEMFLAQKHHTMTSIKVKANICVIMSDASSLSSLWMHRWKDGCFFPSIIIPSGPEAPSDHGNCSLQMMNEPLKG